MIPWYETVWIEHPKIPDSRHEVPKDSLAIMQRSGWALAEQEPEGDVKPEQANAETQEKEKSEETKTNTDSSSRKTTTKKEETK